MTTLCIYHGNCADGFTAAWVVRKALGDNVEFHPGVYGDAPPDVTGRDVIMVDFSYKRPVLEQMCRQARSMLILDHHETAQEDLADLDAVGRMGECPLVEINGCWVECWFDMERSGAGMAWEYYFRGQKPPQTLLHVEDRDLWRFKLEGTREIQACIFSYPYDFEVWDRLMLEDPQALRSEGAAIERKHFKDIREFINVAQHRAEIGGYSVPVLNAPYFWSSDAGHIMAQGEPFAACYWDTPDGTTFSLRSTEDGINVATVAKQYGGGGHKNAAGFRVSQGHARNLLNAA